MRILLTALLAVILLACGKSEPTDGTESKQQAGEAAMQQPQSGLQIKVLQNGDGAVASAGKTVTVHYSGWLFDAEAEDNIGKKFDSSVDRGRPFVFPLGAGRVIQGWDKGVEGMKVGEKRRLIIPPELGYGERGAGNVIPGGSTLVFDVELLVVQ